MLQNPLHEVEEEDDKPGSTSEKKPSTFKRTNTAMMEAMESTMFERANTFTLAFNRTLTDMATAIDPDLMMTNKLIENFNMHDEERKFQGDFPLQTGFGRKREFWKIVLLLGITALVVAIIALGFMNFNEQIPKEWQTCDYSNDHTCGDQGTGKWWFILVPTGTGLIVGLYRWAVQYPRDLPGLFKEIDEQHVDPTWSTSSLILSGISLAGGANLGPEMALSTLGGALATCVHEYIVEIRDADDRALMTLSGMAAALGALFPSPLLGVLLIIELGCPLPKTFMEGTMMMSITACIAFLLYYHLQPLTYLEHISDSAIQLSEAWLVSGFHEVQIIYGFIIGIVSSGVCLMVVSSLGLMKQVFSRIRERFRRNAFLKEIVPAVVGGLIIGLVNYSLPATIGNGNMEINYFMKYGGAGGSYVLSKSLLYKTLFARMLLLGTSHNCGFVGGIVFPFLTMGVICGVLCNQYFPGMPLGLCISTFFVSVGMGVIPAPFCFTALSCLVFFLGVYQCTVVFVAALTSYCIMSGTGLFKKVVVNNGEKQMARDKENAIADAIADGQPTPIKNGSSHGSKTPPHSYQKPLSKTAEEEKRFKLAQLLGSSHDIRDSNA